MAGPNVSVSIAKRLYHARRRHPDMTLTHAADFLGITVDQYIRLENGDDRPTGEQIVLLADLMSVEPSWFFKGSEKRG